MPAQALSLSIVVVIQGKGKEEVLLSGARREDTRRRRFGPRAGTFGDSRPHSRPRTRSFPRYTDRKSTKGSELIVVL